VRVDPVDMVGLLVEVHIHCSPDRQYCFKMDLGPSLEMAVLMMQGYPNLHPGPSLEMTVLMMEGKS